jgi:hypothetical protein
MKAKSIFLVLFLILPFSAFAGTSLSADHTAVYADSGANTPTFIQVNGGAMLNVGFVTYNGFCLVNNDADNFDGCLAFTALANAHCNAVSGLPNSCAASDLLQPNDYVEFYWDNGSFQQIGDRFYIDGDGTFCLGLCPVSVFVSVPSTMIQNIAQNVIYAGSGLLSLMGALFALFLITKYAKKHIVNFRSNIRGITRELKRRRKNRKKFEM